MKMKKIAIIGSGISGLTCAYHLSQDHDVTVFEAAGYLGGHTHTVAVDRDGEHSKIDTGFIVFNDRTYPNFIKLLDQLGVAYQPTEMSFSARNDSLGLEYNGNNLNTLFAQRSNIFRPRFWRMVFDIMRFNNGVQKEAESDPEATVGGYLARTNYSSLFKDNYLLPMISAIWSMGLESCLDFPLRFFVQFFNNHGLLQVSNRPQWYTINGGSSSYIEPLTSGFRDKILLNTPVTRVERQSGRLLVEALGETMLFDDVVFACHGDQALALLSKPTNKEKVVLQNFTFNENEVVLHTDISHLPQNKIAWASWNYKVVDAGKKSTALTYNMNILQRLTKKHTYLVTLNQEIAEQHVLKRFSYSHPVYTTESVAAQQQWHTISGVDNLHFCGAYWFNGFHEDGVRSALRVCDMLERYK